MISCNKLQFLTSSFYKTNLIFVRRKALTPQNINPIIKNMYLMDTDDPVYLRAKRLKQRLKQCPGSLRFDEILEANSGDMQSSGYHPITFLRQVATVCLYPALLEDQCFPDDVKCKATEILNDIKSVGSYTMSPGLQMIRIKLADYFCRRDGGVPRNFKNVVLNNGATEGVANILKLLYGSVDCKQPAVLMASPSYPFGVIELLGFKLIRYELDEDNGWASTTRIMEGAIAEAREKYNLRAMVVVNPSSSTGTVIKLKELQDIVKFACKEKLVLVVDETYQRNIYGRNEFHSIMKVIANMGKPYSEIEVVSLFSISKDITGEAGLRAGAMELRNFNEDVMFQFQKSISVNLCSNAVGQVMICAFIDHPVEGDPSYKLWKEETGYRLNCFSFKAKTLADELNKFEGFSCPPIEGGLFAFPKICVPKKAVEEGKIDGYGPSTFYAMRLLEETGVLVTPGDVFGKESNPHIRISILPSEEKIKTILNKINCFNQNFLLKYAG